MNAIDRRTFLTRSAATGLAAAAPLGHTCLAQQPSAPRREALPLLMTQKTQQAVDRGLVWLARKQHTRGRTAGAFGTQGYPGGVAVCGLGGLAFMCSGDSPGIGKYGRHINRCVDCLLRYMQPSGFMTSPGGQDQMYGHGFATLFLAQAYGMSMRKELGEKLRKAVGLIIATQNDVGGWRYRPQKSDADLSITICQIMALRGARDAGINVPKKTRDLCIDYVKKSQNDDGGFRYTITGGSSTFPLTAAGLVSLYSAGIYEGEAIEKGLKRLMTFLPGSGGTGNSYYYYGHYYAAQAMWHAGGEHWKKWYPAIRDTLISAQKGDGSWVDSSVGAEFGTAMACIILQIPNNYLPVFAK